MLTEPSREPKNNFNDTVRSLLQKEENKLLIKGQKYLIKLYKNDYSSLIDSMKKDLQTSRNRLPKLELEKSNNPDDVLSLLVLPPPTEPEELSSSFPHAHNCIPITAANTPANTLFLIIVFLTIFTLHAELFVISHLISSQNNLLQRPTISSWH